MENSTKKTDLSPKKKDDISVSNLNSSRSKSVINDDSNESPRKKHHKHKHKRRKDKRKKANKAIFRDEQFTLNGKYNIIKMLGFGTFGEILLAYDLQVKKLRAIKFELVNMKNPQLKHEYNVYQELNIMEDKKDTNTT